MRRVAWTSFVVVLLSLAGAHPADARAWRPAAPVPPVLKRAAPVPAPAIRREIRAVRHHLATPTRASAQAGQPQAKDSVKNGIIIGAIAGGAYGATFAAVSGDELTTSGKVGVLWTSAAVGAGLGWLIDWLR